MATNRFTYKHFDALTPHELYAILQLRNEVFVVEQNCVFQDADNKDPHCYHIMVWQNNLLAGYTRLVPAGIAYQEPSIGRVVTSPQVRGNGTGRELMQFSIRTLYMLWGKSTITIGAQLYLRKFYESLGFQQSGDIYLEDGIEHIKMFLVVAV
jgi:ElaA protein